MPRADKAWTLGLPHLTVRGICKPKAKVLEEIKSASPKHTTTVRKRHIFFKMYLSFTRMRKWCLVCCLRFSATKVN